MKKFSPKQQLPASLIFLSESLSLEEKIGESRRPNWLEETFVNQQTDDVAQSNKNYLGLVISGRRLYWALFVIILGMLLLFGRSAYLQLWRGHDYAAAAEKNRLRLYNLPAPRGLIFDRRGIALVKNVPTFAMYLTPNELSPDEEGRQALVNWLYQVFGTEINETLQKIFSIKPNVKEYFEPIMLQDDLTQELAFVLQIEATEYRGVSVDVLPKREYLNNYQGVPVSSLAHLLGYVGKITESEYAQLKNSGYLYNDNIGKIGLEAYYEEKLRGQYGKERLEIDAAGTVKKILAREEMRPGDNLYLSLDLAMQAKLESIIKQYLARYGKKRAAAVVLEATTGKVLSLISLPSYDNNLFASGISVDDYQKLITDQNLPLINRAISGEYAPGSTFKTIVGSAGLEEGLISGQTTFMSVGGIRVGEWFFPDWRTGGHGLTDIRKAIADSVNTYFYILGGGYQEREGLGVARIKKYAEKFGLNAPGGIDLIGESAGFLPSPEWKEAVKNERWYIGDTYHLSIGQGDVLVTPLQVALYNNVFASQGMLFTPLLLDHYYEQANARSVAIPPIVNSQRVVSANTVKIIREGMRRTVTVGSAVLLNNLPVSAAAKTGTAQWRENASPHAWFMAFAPYENTEISLAIIVEEGEEGSRITAQIANDFLSWYFREYRRDLTESGYVL